MMMRSCLSLTMTIKSFCGVARIFGRKFFFLSCQSLERFRQARALFKYPADAFLHRRQQPLYLIKGRMSGLFFGRLHEYAIERPLQCPDSFEQGAGPGQTVGNVDLAEHLAATAVAHGNQLSAADATELFERGAHIVVEHNDVESAHLSRSEHCRNLSVFVVFDGNSHLTVTR